MDEEGREFSRESVSRRSVLKGMGAGAAIAWSAPVLQSLAAPALAQYDGCAAPCSACFGFGGTSECGNSGPFGICFCAQTTEGNCFCGENTDCTFTDDCATSGDCGAGQQCIAVGCTGCTTHQCMDPCGTNPAARRAKGATGKSAAER